MQEFRQIREFKREKSGRRTADLEPWDEAYYTSFMKSETYDLDSTVTYTVLYLYWHYNFFINLQLHVWLNISLFQPSRFRLTLFEQPSFLQVVASYFSLPQCIEGLKALVHSLFGATFQSVPLGHGESWHPDVLKMSLHHPDEVFKCIIANPGH